MKLQVGGVQCNYCVPFFEKEIEIWHLNKLAIRYGCRPSEIFHIDDEVMAYDFDSSVMWIVERIERDGWKNVKINKDKQTKGFKGAKALQQSVHNYYEKRKGR